MPLYVYKCQTCGEVFERRERYDDPPTVTCQECGVDDVVRVIQPTAVRFVGVGFYVNDIGKGNS